jgi:hypothetical protein
MTDVPDSHAAARSRHLELNARTWEALQEAGVGENSELRLDFFYVAPGEQEGEELVRFLREEKGYRAEVQSQRKGLLSKRTWTVVGETGRMAVSLAVLDDWVIWMIDAGAQHGACDFDGWGAAVP